MSAEPPVVNDENRHCSNCGAPAFPTAQFCVSCGAALPNPAPEDGWPKVPWRAVEGIGIFLIVLILTLVGALIAARLASRDVATTVGTFLNEALLIVVLLVWIRKRHHVGTEALRLKGTAADAGIGVAVGAVGYFVANIAGGLLIELVREIANRPIKEPEQISFDQTPNVGLLVALGIAVVVLAPIAEEMFFRGFLFQGFRNWARPGMAIFLSALFFALAHFLPLVIPPIFLLGLMLAAVVNRRGSLVPSIAAHMTFNAIGFTFLVVQVR